MGLTIGPPDGDVPVINVTLHADGRIVRPDGSVVQVPGLEPDRVLRAMEDLRAGRYVTFTARDRDDLIDQLRRWLAIEDRRAPAEGPVTAAFRELADAADGRWDGVDVDEYMREMRGDA